MSTVPSKKTIQVQVNGQPLELPIETTVSQLLKRLEIHNRGVAVEINFEIVVGDSYGDSVLNDGDNVEVVTLFGGG